MDRVAATALAIGLGLGLAARPGDAATTAGRVVLPSGEPAAGARVEAYRLEASTAERARILAALDRVAVSSAVTSDDGRFALDLPDRTVVEVAVELDGMAPWAAEVLAGDGLGTAVLRAAPLREGAVTLEGRAAAAATLVWRDGSGRPAWVVRSGGDGRYAVPEPSAWASSVTVLHPRAAPFEASSYDAYLELTLHEGDLGAGWSELPVDLELVRGRSLTGRVMAGDEPAAGARIAVDGWPLAVSGEDGRFTVRAGEDELLVEALAGARYGSRSVTTGESGVAVQLGEPRTLRGEVVDGGGRGIAGVRVQVGWGGDDLYEVGAVRRAVTGARGRFVVDGAPPGIADLWVWLPGYAVDEPYVEVDLRRASTGSHRFVAERRPPLVGIVLAGGGSPVTGARILPAWSGGRPAYGMPAGLDRVVESDADGRFTISWTGDEPGEQWMVLAPGMPAAVFEATYEGDRPSPIEVRLPAGAEVAFEVADPAGRALPGATVAIAEGPATWSPAASLVAPPASIEWLYRTAGDGSLAVRLRPGVHHVAFQAPGYAPLGIDGFDVEEGGTSPVRVVLQPSASIAGRVVYADDGAPVVGAELVAQGDTVEARGQSGAEGRFLLEELSAGPYVVRAAVVDALVPPPLRVEAPGAGVVLAVERGLELSGVVVDRETLAPIAGAEVRCARVGTADTEHRIATTGVDGGFTVRALRPGRVVVEASADGFVAGESPEIALTAGEPTPPVELALEPGRAVGGTVVDGQRQPVADVLVSTAGSDRPLGRRSASTDADGAYRLAGLPGGEHEIRFAAEGFVGRTVTVDVVAFEEHLDVVLDRGDTLRGVVYGEDGEALQDVPLGLSRSGAGSHGAASGEDGRFEIGGLEVGALWELEASKQGYEPQTLSGLDPLSGDVELWLRPMASGVVFGEVVGADPVDVGAIGLTVWGPGGSAEGAIEADGTYVVDEAPAGDVTVRLSLQRAAGGVTLSRRALVPERGRVRVDFDLEGRVHVRGWVVRGEEPQARAFVQLERVGGGGEVSARTGIDGGFSATVEAGSYLVSVWVPDGTWHEQRAEIRGPTTLEIDVSGAVLLGRVLDAMTGDGVGGATVELLPAERDDEVSLRLPEVETDGAGGFAMSDAPVGRFLLRAVHPELAARLVEVELARGETTIVEIALEPTEGLVVELVDARTGEALSGPIVVRDLGGAVIWNGDPQPHGNGFRLPLGEGVFKVSVSADGRASRTVTASAPAAEPLRIGLTPGGAVVVRSESLEGRTARLIAPDGEEYVRCWCNQISAFRVEGSQTTLEHIAPGIYTLVVHERDGVLSSYPLEVLEGLTVELGIR